MDGTRKRITRQDIIALKDKFDKLKVPTAGRRLVLCTDHVNDLLLQEQKFADQYYNYQTGKIANLYGFEVYEFVGNPYYNTSGVKQAVRPPWPSTCPASSRPPALRRCTTATRRPTR